MLIDGPDIRTSGSYESLQHTTRSQMEAGLTPREYVPFPGTLGRPIGKSEGPRLKTKNKIQMILAVFSNNRIKLKKCLLIIYQMALQPLSAFCKVKYAFYI